MRISNARPVAIVALLVWCGSVLLSSSSLATLPIQKQAKEAGLPAANCQYCHVEKLPKKGEATHNDKGKWLIAEKDKRKAKEVDGAWLKDYTGDKTK